MNDIIKYIIGVFILGIALALFASFTVFVIQSVYVDQSGNITQDCKMFMDSFLIAPYHRDIIELGKLKIESIICEPEIEVTHVATFPLWIVDVQNTVGEHKTCYYNVERCKWPWKDKYE